MASEEKEVSYRPSRRPESGPTNETHRCFVALQALHHERVAFVGDVDLGAADFAGNVGSAVDILSGEVDQII